MTVEPQIHTPTISQADPSSPRLFSPDLSPLPLPRPASPACPKARWLQMVRLMTLRVVYLFTHWWPCAPLLSSAPPSPSVRCSLSSPLAARTAATVSSRSAPESSTTTRGRATREWRSQSTRAQNLSNHGPRPRCRRLGGWRRHLKRTIAFLAHQQTPTPLPPAVRCEVARRNAELVPWKARDIRPETNERPTGVKVGAR